MAKQNIGLYQTVSQSDFMDAFRACGRRDQFSYEALQALFEYLENLADDTREPLELDVIALCCEFSEYESLKAFQAEYSTEYESIDDIENETTVIRIDDDRFLIAAF